MQCEAPQPLTACRWDLHWYLVTLQCSPEGGRREGRGKRGGGGRGRGREGPWLGLALALSSALRGCRGVDPTACPSVPLLASPWTGPRPVPGEEPQSKGVLLRFDVGGRAGDWGPAEGPCPIQDPPGVPGTNGTAPAVSCTHTHTAASALCVNNLGLGKGVPTCFGL